MNLKELRTQFVKRNGRYDLVVDNVDWADNGANFYINSGQRYIDRLDTVKRSTGKTFRPLSAGGYYVTFPFCRAIQEAWALSSTAQTKLTKIDFQELREYYSAPVSSIGRGLPSFYFPAGIRLVPEADRLPIEDLDAILIWAHVTIDPSYNYNSIMLFPPSDGSYTIEVDGLFYQPELLADTDTNFWSEVHPEILLMAANRQLEIDYRNSTGVKDWDMAIQTEILGLGKDLVEEHIAEVNQMEG